MSAGPIGPPGGPPSPVAGAQPAGGKLTLEVVGQGSRGAIVELGGRRVELAGLQAETGARLELPAKVAAQLGRAPIRAAAPPAVVDRAQSIVVTARLSDGRGGGFSGPARVALAEPPAHGLPTPRAPGAVAAPDTEAIANARGANTPPSSAPQSKLPSPNPPPPNPPPSNAPPSNAPRTNAPPANTSIPESAPPRTPAAPSAANESAGPDPTGRSAIGEASRLVGGGARAKPAAGSASSGADGAIELAQRPNAQTAARRPAAPVSPAQASATGGAPSETNRPAQPRAPISSNAPAQTPRPETPPPEPPGMRGPARDSQPAAGTLARGEPPPPGLLDRPAAQGGERATAPVVVVVERAGATARVASSELRGEIDGAPDFAEVGARLIVAPIGEARTAPVDAAGLEDVLRLLWLAKGAPAEASEPAERAHLDGAREETLERMRDGEARERGEPSERPREERDASGADRRDGPPIEPLLDETLDREAASLRILQRRDALEIEIEFGAIGVWRIEAKAGRDGQPSPIVVAGDLSRIGDLPAQIADALAGEPVAVSFRGPQRR